MPTYDYECQACNHHFERWQEMSARKLRTCPECGKRKLVRLVGAGAGVIFRGSGFYETDYKRKQSKPASSSSSSSSESTSKSKSDGKSESDGRSKSDGKSKGEGASSSSSDASSSSSSKSSGDSGAKSGTSRS